MQSGILLHLELERLFGLVVLLGTDLQLGALLLDLAHQGLDLLLLRVELLILLVDAFRQASDRVERLAHVAWEVSSRRG